MQTLQEYELVKIKDDANAILDSYSYLHLLDNDFDICLMHGLLGLIIFDDFDADGKKLYTIHMVGIDKIFTFPEDCIERLDEGFFNKSEKEVVSFVKDLKIQFLKNKKQMDAEPAEIMSLYKKILPKMKMRHLIKRSKSMLLIADGSEQDGFRVVAHNITQDILIRIMNDLMDKINNFPNPEPDDEKPLHYDLNANDSEGK